MIDNVTLANGSEIAVEVTGKGKQVVILVHGIGSSSSMWLPFAYQHPKDFKFVIPNLRGFGKSTAAKFDNPEDVLLDYANDIKALIDHYAPDGKVILAGMSMGAYSCMRYFQEFGTGRVIKYLNIDQGPKAMNSNTWRYGIGGETHEGLFGAFKSLMKAFEPKLGMEFVSLENPFQDEYISQLRNFFSLAFHRSAELSIVDATLGGEVPVLRHLARGSTQCVTWQSYYHCLKSYVDRDYDFRKTMAKLDIPLTLHIGRHSHMYPARGQYYMAHHAPLCKVVEFDESHALMYTAPMKFSFEFAKFLSAKALP